MFQFKNKTILILSPQAWGKMHISKHHYAIELAKRNNNVFFFNPPSRNGSFKIKTRSNEYKNLTIISYRFFFPYILRFHLRKLFDKLQSVQIKKILKKIKHPDIIWCFDTNLFSDLRVFNANIKIYHPVDNVFGKNQKKLIQSSDYIFSVSDVIIKNLKKIDSTKDIKFINHGLSEYFINFKNYSVVPENKRKPINAYFLGNVLLTSLDRNITKKIILENKDINFVFVGAYTKRNISNVDDDALNFVGFLKDAKNVLLKGAMHPKEAVKELKKSDVLLVLINPEKDQNKGSNSHKILEYLSTGKVIVANHISTYKNKPGLIEMVDEMHNEKLPILFKKVINNLEYYNSPELQKNRIEFALDNTYEKQIERIEKYINEKKENNNNISICRH